MTLKEALQEARALSWTEGGTTRVIKLRKVEELLRKVFADFEETNKQLRAREMLVSMGISPTCRFGPHEYEKLELMLATLLTEADREST